MQFIRSFIRVLFSILGLFLVLVFILRIFAPGTAQTEAVFQLLKPIQPLSDKLAAALTFPFDFVWRFIAPFLPPSVTSWFPVTPATGTLGWLGELLINALGGPQSEMGRNLKGWENGLQNIPGVLDWRLLIALPIWAYVESTLLGLISRIESRKARQQAIALQASMRESFRERKPEPLPEKPAASRLLGSVTQGIQGNIGALRGHAQQDSLTKLLTKVHFSQLLTDEINHAKQSNRTLAIIFLDLDDLRVVNDAYGAAAGDAALVQTALAIQRTEAPHGRAIASRYGGEEFVVLLTETTAQTARFMAEAMLERIREVQLPQHPEVRLTASAGVYTVCFVPTNGSYNLTDTSFTGKAEAQLLQAKRAGKNQLMAAALP